MLRDDITYVHFQWQYFHSQKHYLDKVKLYCSWKIDSCEGWRNLDNNSDALLETRQFTQLVSLDFRIDGFFEEKHRKDLTRSIHTTHCPLLQLDARRYSGPVWEFLQLVQSDLVIQRTFSPRAK